MGPECYCSHLGQLALLFSQAWAPHIMIAFRADGNGSVRVSLPSLSVNHLQPLWLLKRRAARVKGGGNWNEKGNERRAGTAHKSKQFVSPKDCLQGPAMPTITFLQVHFAPRRKEAPHGPREGLRDEHGGRGGRGRGREAEGRGRKKHECKSKCRFVDTVRRACWLTGWFIGFFQLITAGLWPNGSPAKLKGSRGKQAYKHKAA